MINISTRGGIFQRLSLSKLLLLSILVQLLSTASSCSESDPESEPDPTPSQPMPDEPNTDDGPWIDPIFAQVLQDKGYISDAATVTPDDVAHIEALGVDGDGPENPGPLTSLKGIEYFTSLRSLTCRGNKITQLDLSKNINLEDCDCSWSELKQLELGNLTKLWYLMCMSNPLTKLDVSKTGLRILVLWGNQLSDLKLNTQLEVLECMGNQLTQLDVSNCTQLYQLLCYENQLTQLDISKNSEMKTLWCYSNQIAQLDTSNSTQLETLLCGSNQLTQLDISKNSQLKSFNCWGNPVKNGKFPIKAWFDNSNVSIGLEHDVSWMYNGSTVTIEFYK